MNSHRNKPTDDLVRRAVEATLQLPAPDGPAARIVSQTLAALEEAERRSHTTFLQRINQMPWLSKATAVLATAASVFIVYLGVTSFTGRALAFADVVDVLNHVRSATWKMTTKAKGPDNQLVAMTHECMFLAPSHERREITAHDGKSVIIMDGQKNQVLILEPKSKTATYIEVKNIPDDQEGPYGKTFDSFRQMAADAKRGNGGKVTPLDSETIDGRRAEGFRIEHGSIEVKIWADPETSVPIRVEEKVVDDSEVSIVMTDFQVDVPLDESLFSMDVPNGYTLQKSAQIDLSKSPIYYLAEMLKLVAEVNDGVFPSELRGENGIDGISRRNAAGLAQKIAEEMTEDQGQITPDTQRRATMDLSMKLGGAFGFMFALSPEQNDWHYDGKDVKLNTPDKPIFWFRRHKASDTYHVLFADLSVKDVPASEVPKDTSDDPKP